MRCMIEAYDGGYRITGLWCYGAFTISIQLESFVMLVFIFSELTSVGHRVPHYGIFFFNKFINAIL
jgi:hypothetical protein